MSARIALLGLILESNRFATPTRETDFRSYAWLEGSELTSMMGLKAYSDFVPVMDSLRAWVPAPILLAAAESGGPLDARDYARIKALLLERLRSAMPVDGVFVFGHGAGSTTECDDLDGDYLAAVRSVVGAEVPIVVELDFHANVSRRMLKAVDAIVGYRTNPHVDVAARAGDSARLLHRLLSGDRLFQATCRLPLVTAQVAQLTERGEPVGDLIGWAGEAATPDIADWSVFPGFAFTDTAYNGFTTYACSFVSQAAADGFANRLAAQTWTMRCRFCRPLTSISEAVAEAARIGAGDGGEHLVIADVADNPGGGGSATTIWLLKALLAADATQTVIGLFHDPLLVADATAAGVGGRFTARFNRRSTDAFAQRFDAPARVEALCDGRFVNRTGVAAGQAFALGSTALLRIDGLLVGISSQRHQLLSPDFFAAVGVDLASVRTFVVKSRGHFRAGFATLSPVPRVLEVDTPGLTTADLDNVRWERLPRPIFPLDPDTSWNGDPA